MRVDVDLAHLSSALRRVRPALRDAADGGQLVRLNADAEGLRLTATGRTLTVSTSIDATVAQVGPITVPARLLIDLAAKGLDERMSLSTDGAGDLGLACGGLTATLRHYPGVSPAGIDLKPGVGESALTAEECRRISAITFACSTSAERPVLTGVHLRPGTAEATDSYRIAMTSLADWSLDVVAPANVLSLVANEAQPAAAAFDGRVIRFSNDRTTWTSPVLPRSYPQLDQFFREPVRDQLICNRSALAHAVSAAATIPGAFVDLIGTQDRVTIHSESTQLGTVRFDVATMAALTGTRTFTAAYLSEALSIAVGDDITIDFTDRAAIIRCAEFEQFVLLRVDNATRAD